jgi:tetratricopeptide (TPR) repeat protein
VYALLAAFYEHAWEPKQMESHIASVLAKYPRSSPAHEVAGYFAVLQADAPRSIDHFIAAASDLDSPLTALYLFELNRYATTVSEDKRIERLAEALRLQHPSADVRDFARQRAVTLRRVQLQLAAAQPLTDELEYLRDWNLIGPFDNDQGKGFLTTYPPESKLALGERYPGKLMEVGWRKAASDATGSVSLQDMIAPSNFVLGYLQTFVGSDGAGPAELRLNVRDAVQIWWNDVLVASEEGIDPSIAENVVVPVALQKGWNKLLIKSCVRDTGWAISARVTRAGGGAWAGLRTSREPQPFAAGAATVKPAPSAFLPSAVAGLPDGGRKQFLTSRYAEIAGRRKQLVPPLEQFAKTVPDNALATYQLALSYWRNDELGKAIDLLNAGVRRYPDLAEFWRERASYYRQKKLWDRALADLRKVAALRSAVPALNRREATFALSFLYQARGFTLDRCRELGGLAAAVPDFAVTHMYFAQCREDLGYVASAEREIEAAVALEPGDYWFNQRLLELRLRRLDYDGALAANGRLRQLYPASIELLMQRANIERERGARQAARVAYEQVRAQIPDYALVYQRLAELEYEDGRAQQATELYRLALARSPSSSDLAERIAFLDPSARGVMESLVPNDEQLEAVLQGASSVKALPGSNTLMLLDQEVVEIGNDGSARRTITAVTRAENQQGVDQLIRVNLPTYGARKVLCAYALSASGERQEASSIQDDAVRFRKLETGSITVLQYVLYQPSGPFLPNHYTAVHDFQRQDSQLEKATWVVVHDKDRELQVAIHGAVKEVRSELGGRVVRAFSAEHVAPLLVEPFMPPLPDLLQHVAITTLGSWDEFQRWQQALMAQAYRSSPELQAFANRVTLGASTPREKLERLFHAVAKDIRYQIDQESSIAGVRPHAAPVTLERGYGDCKDKAVLLIELAKLAGLKLELVLLRTTDRGQLLREIPNQQFNHAIVHVPQQPGIDAPLFLDPTTDGLDVGNLRQDDQGAIALVLDEEGPGYRFIPIPYQGPEVEYWRQTIRVQITSPTAASAADAISARGTMAQSFRTLLRNSEVANKSLQQMASALFTGAILQKRSAERPEDLWHPIELDLTLDISNAIRSQGDDWRLYVPASWPDFNAADLAIRHTPIRFGPSGTTSTHVEIELPEGFRVVTAPPSFQVEHRCFSAKRTTHTDGRNIDVSFDYTRRCPRVEVDDYPEFRKAILDLRRGLSSEVVFARDTSKKPAPKREPPKPEARKQALR